MKDDALSPMQVRFGFLWKKSFNSLYPSQRAESGSVSFVGDSGPYLNVKLGIALGPAQGNRLMELSATTYPFEWLPCWHPM